MSDTEEDEEDEDKDDSYAISEEEEEEDSGDDEQMAEIRRKILGSKSFQDPVAATSDEQQPEKIQTVSRPGKAAAESDDAESGNGTVDSEDEAFDKIIDAGLVTDRTGIIAMQKRKEKDALTASLSMPKNR